MRGSAGRVNASEAVHPRQRLFIPVLAIGLVACDPAVPQPVHVSSTATQACHGCTLTIDSVSTIGGGTKPESYFETAAIDGVVVGERLMIAATVPVQVFSLEGRALGTLGRRGKGPGEFPSWITGMGVDARRNLHVFVVQEVVVFDSTLRFDHKVTLARGSLRPTVLSDGKYAGIARLTGSAIGTPPRKDSYIKTFEQPLFHLFSATGAHIRSIGTRLSLADGIIAPGADGTVWTAKHAPYELRQWAQDGALLRVFARSTPRFGNAPYLGPWPYVPGERPRARLLAMRQDERDHLWTAFSVKRPDASPNVASTDPIADCCETIIEVLDSATGDLLGTGRVPSHVYDFLADGYILTKASRDQDEPLVGLYRARLTLPPGR